MPTVRMPDGVNVNFPDSMPKAEIQSMIVSKFPDLASETPAPKAAAPEKSTYDNIIGGMSNYAQGLVPFADEAIAGIAAPITSGISQFTDNPISVGDAYDEGAQFLRKAEQDFSDDNPVTANALLLLGGVTGGLGMAKGFTAAQKALAPKVPGIVNNAAAVVSRLGAKAPKAAQKIARLGQMAGVGGATGYVYGAGEGEGAAKERFSSDEAKDSALLGMALSPAIRGAVGVAKGVKRIVGGATADDIMASTGQVFNNSAKYLDALKKARASGDLKAIVDLDAGAQGLARATRKAGGTAQDIVETQMERRKEKALSQVSKKLRENVSGKGYFESLEEIDTVYKELSKPAWKAAYEAPFNPSGELQQLLKRPIIKEAMGELKDLGKIEGFDVPPDLLENPTVASLQKIKRGLDSLYNQPKYSNEFGSPSELGSALLSLKNQIIKAANSPAWDHARSIGSNRHQLINASKKGLEYARKKALGGDIKREISKMSMAEKEAVRSGYADGLLMKFGSASTPFSQMNKPYVKQQIKAVLGDDAGKFFNELKFQSKGEKAYTKVMGGSQTDINLAEGGFTKGLLVVGDFIRNGGLPLTSTVQFIERRYRGLNNKNARAVAHMLTTPGKSIELLERFAKLKDPNQLKLIRELVKDIKVGAVASALSSAATESKINNQ
mgnify:CR=1 FL=1